MQVEASAQGWRGLHVDEWHSGNYLIGQADIAGLLIVDVPDLDVPDLNVPDLDVAGERQSLSWTGVITAPAGSELAQVVSYRIEAMSTGASQSALGGFSVVFNKDRVFRSGFEVSP